MARDAKRRGAGSSVRPRACAVVAVVAFGLAAWDDDDGIRGGVAARERELAAVRRLAGTVADARPRPATTARS
jgi:hypothetical protein